MKIYSLVLFLWLGACSSSSSGKHPRQDVRYTIICKYFMQQCYFKAQDRCENRGYEILNTNETMRTGGPSGRYREFSLAIKCH